MRRRRIGGFSLERFTCDYFNDYSAELDDHLFIVISPTFIDIFLLLLLIQADENIPFLHVFLYRPRPLGDLDIYHVVSVNDEYASHIVTTDYSHRSYWDGTWTAGY